MNEPGDATKRLGGLAAIEIPSAGPVASAFVSLGITRFGHAVEYVAALPYGRNSDGQQFRLVLSERRGTCSTKHALLAELVTELNLPLDLMLGIFEMGEANTPGVGGVLQAHRLDAIPEAHCYLRSGADRIDATSAAASLRRLKSNSCTKR
jgi:hypothetical protein